MEEDSRMAQTAEQLHRLGLKATGPRIIILEMLEHDRSHPTAEQLHERLRQRYPSLSLSTVYQTLDTFLRAGLCHWVPGVDGRLRVEAASQRHDHAICRVCRKLFDIERAEFSSFSLPEELPHGLLVTDWRVEYEVICSPCQEEAQKSKGQAKASPGLKKQPGLRPPEVPPETS
jgi:Fur family transcriptional regulator, peroxide stress response regulator